RYLVHRDPAQRAFVLANGDLAGSWPVHVREADTSPTSGVGAGKFISLDQRPTIWYDQRAQESGVDYVKGLPLPIREYTFICAPPPAAPDPGCQPVPSNQTRLIPDNAHQPSLAYVPYLLTGDRYYADEMAFWADYAMMRTYNGDGVRGALGILAYNEVRGFGWALRNIAEAAAYHPDSAVRGYLAAKVSANLQWLDAYANAQDPIANPLKLLWIGARPEPGVISLWEQTYLAYGIDRANRLGFSGGLAHRDAIASLQLKLFSSAPAYPRETTVSAPITLPDGTVVPAGTVLTWSAPYIVGAGTPNAGGGFTYNKTMADVWTQTSDLSLQRNYAGYYGPEARMNLMIGVESGWAGAQNAYDYLWPFIGVDNFWGTSSAPVPDLAERAGWALDFYVAAGTSPPSSPAPAPAQLLTPATGAAFGSSAQSFTWTAGTGVTGYRLDLGTTQGGTNLYAGVESAAQSAYVTRLPVDGSTVWARLSSRIDGAVQTRDYSFASYTAAGAGSPGLAPRRTVVASGNSTIQTAPFDTAADDVLVAFVSSSGPPDGGETMSVTGGGLAWTLVSRANVQLGVSEFWTATTPAARTGIVVTSTHTL